MSLRTTALVDASVPEAATLSQAARALLEVGVPALAVVSDDGRVLGVLSGADVLRAVFPGYLEEVRHTAFLTDDAESLDALARSVRDEPVLEFARPVEPLGIDDSQIHAAERFLHADEDALPVVDGERFVGMVTVAALGAARLSRVDDE